MDTIEQLAEQLLQTRTLEDDSLLTLLSSPQAEQPLRERADQVRRLHYGREVYIRGLIEISNYCKNNCYYCGIRRDNREAVRYRLTEEEIVSCCRQGYGLGFRTFVLQGGEDGQHTDGWLCRLICRIKESYPDCAVTLSLGERSKASYRQLFSAGADRYLLRHETAVSSHYARLHPETMEFSNRLRCLYDLKEIGDQVGSGFMVGSPGQKGEYLVEDLRLLQQLQPDMIGIGPFLHHAQTPFRDAPNGDLHLTLRMISILRLMFPYALIPATTALGTLHPQGRELGLQAGANVVMPNLSPVRVRKLYSLYDNKISTDEEAAEGKSRLEQRVLQAGYQIVTARGDVKKQFPAACEKDRKKE